MFMFQIFSSGTHWQITVYLYTFDPGGWVTPRKIWWRRVARVPKPLTYLWPKYVIFPTPFMTRPKIWYPVCDRCGWHRQNFWRKGVSFKRKCGAASVGVLQDNLVLSTGLIMWISHGKEIRKLTFRALALRGSESNRIMFEGLLFMV